MVVGSMVGAGIFSLPATFGRATGPFGAIIAWAIARYRHVNAGVRFPNYCAAQARSRYWHIRVHQRRDSAIISASPRRSILRYEHMPGQHYLFYPDYVYAGAVLPGLRYGNTLVATILSSAILWSVHFMILRGVKEMAGVNTVVTIAKIVPIAIFIICLMFFFSASKFADNFWGGSAYSSVICSSRSAGPCW